ncbi:hypothetical protein FWK35_00013363 [Aphis craccivora]|nr:hypothetical protein FWK35_00013363 [Aphis craccivora]
MGIFTQN